MPLDGHSSAPPRSRGGLMLAGLALAFVLGVVVARRRGPQWGLNNLDRRRLLGARHRHGRRHCARCGDAGGRMVAPWLGGLAIATETISATFFLALAGAIFAWGHDGLAFTLGLGAGCLLLQLVVAPRLPQTGARSLPELFAWRYPGRATRFLCAIIVSVSMLALITAELIAAGVAGARLLEVDYATAAIIAACAVFACFILRGMSGAPWVNGVLFPIMLVAVLVPLVQLSVAWYGLPVPQLAYVNALWQIQGLEETLLEQDLADPAFMKPMLTAFVSLTPMNFLGIVLGLATGVAALPSLMPAQLAAAPGRDARWSAVWGLVFVTVFLTLAPPSPPMPTLIHQAARGPHAPCRPSGMDLHLWQAGAREVCGGRRLTPSSRRRAQRWPAAAPFYGCRTWRSAPI